MRMSLVLLGFASVLLGAVGVELLRGSNPELVAKVEESAKRLVVSFGRPEADGDEARKK